MQRQLSQFFFLLLGVLCLWTRETLFILSLTVQVYSSSWLSHEKGRFSCCWGSYHDLLSLLRRWSVLFWRFGCCFQESLRESCLFLFSSFLFPMCFSWHHKSPEGCFNCFKRLLMSSLLWSSFFAFLYFFPWKIKREMPTTMRNWSRGCRWRCRCSSRSCLLQFLLSHLDFFLRTKKKRGTHRDFVNVKDARKRRVRQNEKRGKDSTSN